MGLPVRRFEAVVMAGGMSKKLFPLVSGHLPKALLPLCNRPVLWYVLQHLEASCFRDLLVVVEGQEAAHKIGSWIAEAFAGRLNVEVAAVPEDTGSADALRAILHRLTGENFLVVSGDLVCDVGLGALASVHRRHEAVATALLCPRSATSASDSASAGGGKEKSKEAAPLDVVGLSSSNQSLLSLASALDASKEVRVSRSLLCGTGNMEIRTDLVDAHVYAFKRGLVQIVLEAKPGIRSIKEDLVPYLVRSQFRLQLATRTELQDQHSSSTEELKLWRRLRSVDNGKPSFKCCAYVATSDSYCGRMNSLQAFQNINHELAGEAIQLTGLILSDHSNVVDINATLGSRTAVGPHCLVGEGSEVGDKCTVKRSVIGRHCRIGANVKIMDSVLMNYVTVDDGSVIQGSVLCDNVRLQERCNLRDCQVGAGFVVGTGSQHKSEVLAKREVLGK